MIFENIYFSGGMMYAPTIPQEIHERLPCVLFCASPQETLDRAARLVPAQARVLALPYGGSTYPIL